MAGEEKMNHSNNRVASGFSQVTEDIVTLIELQCQLLTLDSQQAASRVIKAAVAGVIAVVFALSTVLALSMAAAWLIHQYGGLTIGWSLLVVAGCDLIMALITLGLTFALGKRAAGFMKESSAELKENAKWIKSVVLQRDSYPNQIRTRTPDVAAPEATATRGQGSV